MTLDELTERLRDAVQRSPAAFGSLKIALTGVGCIRVESSTVSNDDLPADCTLILSKPDLEAMLDGSLDAQTALMDGRLELMGDVSVAAAMQSTLMAAWTSPGS